MPKNLFWNYINGEDENGTKLSRMFTTESDQKETLSVQEVDDGIMFVDFVNSVQMYRQLGDQMGYELIQYFFNLVKAALKPFHCDIVKHTGDGALILFPSSSVALLGAINIQSASESHNSRHSLLPIEVRIGVNVGKYIKDSIDAYGNSVNLAARICDACTPGSILCSNIVMLRNDKSGFMFKEHTKLSVKGFDCSIQTHFATPSHDFASQNALPQPHSEI